MRHDALYQAIADKPDDDGPRLVYADWLEEHGASDRAEFIRLQCRRAALTGLAGWLRDEAAQPPEFHQLNDWGFREQLSFAVGPPPDEEELRLRQREQELLAAHRGDWVAGPGGPLSFRRGFPDGMCVSVHELLNHADAFAAYPTLRSFHLYLDCGPGSAYGLSYERHREIVETLQQFGMLRRCTDLFACVASHEDWNDLLDWELVPNLRRLVLMGDDHTHPPPPATLKLSAELTWYEATGWRLGQRDDSGDWAGEWIQNTILRGLRGPGLQHLNFSDNAMFDQALIVLAGSANLAALQTLRLSWSYFTSTGIDALGRSPHLGQLRHLDLSYANLSEEALVTLIDSPLLCRLHYLDITGNHISERVIRRLAQTPTAVGLRVLVLAPLWRPEINVTAAGVRALTESPHLTNLLWLSLGNIEMDDALALDLAHAPGLNRLHTLALTLARGDGPGLGAQARAALERRFPVVHFGLRS
jgi:uncharacterized protein (TIGR02996 family)